MNCKCCCECRFWRTRDELKRTVADPRAYDPEHGATEDDWDLDALRAFSSAFGVCKCDAFVYQGGSREDGLIYWDYEGLEANFVTGRKFGCIHYSEKGD